MWIGIILSHQMALSGRDHKAVDGGPAGPDHFFARNGFSRTAFLAKYFFAGPFSQVSSRPSLMFYFSMIKDVIIK